MNEPMQRARLADALHEYGQAYLLTATASGAPHAAGVRLRFENGALYVAGIGRHSRANVAAQPRLAVLWPPRTESGYALIVDGCGTLADDVLRIEPTRAVLTRSSPPVGRTAQGGCASDCIELDFSCA